MKILNIVVVVAATVLMAACGEREQMAGSERTYQGRQDTKPWDNGPPIAQLRGGQWKQGDRASWEESIKQRQLAQHEHKRIYQ
jgi:hypothetical protein